MVTDANGHQAATLIGGLGKTNYTQTYTGTSGNFALYATTAMTYDPVGNLIKTVSPGGLTASTCSATTSLATLSNPACSPNAGIPRTNGGCTGCQCHADADGINYYCTLVYGSNQACLRDSDCPAGQGEFCDKDVDFGDGIHYTCVNSVSVYNSGPDGLKCVSVYSPPTC